MGTEYRIRSDQPLNRQKLDALPRSLLHFAEFESSSATYVFRHPSNPAKMPNISVRIEEGKSLYVCDYGGQPLVSTVIGAVMIHLAHQLENSVQLDLIE